MFLKWLLLVFVLVVLPVLSLMALSLAARPPGEFGLKDGKLQACPPTPNCVCSQDADEEHKVDPIAFVGAWEQAMVDLKGVLKALPRTVVVEEKGDYLRLEARSALFHFVDDMEFHVDAAAKAIHVRAAARSGYSDMGANRRRLENLRKEFERVNAAQK